MLPNKARIRQRSLELQKARIDTVVAKTRLRQSVRNAVVSPRMLVTWFTLGYAAGKRIIRQDTDRPWITSRRLRSLSSLLLMRLF